MGWSANGISFTWARRCRWRGSVMAEATAVADVGRISPGDTGIWNDEQVRAWRPIAAFVAKQGAVPAIQLAHAGWKASTAAPWEGGKAVPIAEGGWEPLVSEPSPLPKVTPCRVH